MSAKSLATALSVMGSMEEMGIDLAAAGVKVTRKSTGCFDRNGKELFLGDRVIYRNESTHTKRDYWNPEYEIVWEPPAFTLKHIGGGKSGDSHQFKLRHGGPNGMLELLSPGSP